MANLATSASAMHNFCILKTLINLMFLNLMRDPPFRDDQWFSRYKIQKFSAVFSQGMAVLAASLSVVHNFSAEPEKKF